MEQIFTSYPNYIASQLSKTPKPENSIIDKYLESRLKMRVDAKAAAAASNTTAATGNHLPSFIKNQKNNRNLKQESNVNSGGNLKSIPAQMANTKTSDILESLRSTNPNYQNNYTSSNLENGSHEVYNFTNQYSLFSTRPHHGGLDEDESVFGMNYRDGGVEHENELLEREQYLGGHKYEFNKELEKTDEKDTASLKDSEDQVSWDINDKVARILRLVQPDDPNIGDDTRHGTTKYNDDRDYRSKDMTLNLERWAGPNDCYSYYIFSVMVLTIALGSLLRYANKMLGSLKVFLDAIFVSCWRWARGAMTRADNNEGNLLIFILCTPILAFLLVLYAGFCIVYYSNRALLSRVPNKIAEQVNLKRIKELST